MQVEAELQSNIELTQAQNGMSTQVRPRFLMPSALGRCLCGRARDRGSCQFRLCHHSHSTANPVVPAAYPTPRSALSKTTRTRRARPALSRRDHSG